jgi:hypothetical protein
MKAILTLAALIVALMVLGFLAWNVGASRALQTAIEETETEWRLDAFLTDYPPREDSTDAAWRLDTAAGLVGLHVIPMQDRMGGEAPGADEWDEVKADVGGYISSLRSSPDDAPPDIPPAVAGFLERHAGDLDEIESLLLGGEDIRFASRLDAGPEAPLPNLLGQISLTRLLSTRAMAARLHGDDEAAWRSLEAGYRLARTLDDQPALICRLILVADLKILAAAARRMDPPLPAWIGELEAMDPRQLMREGVRSDLHFQSTLYRNLEIRDLKDIGGSEEVDAVLNPFGRPLFLWDRAYTLREIDQLARVAMDTDPCAFDPRIAEEATSKRPWWASVTFVRPNIAATFTRANQAALALEGTSIVFELKQSPDAFTTRPSGVCPGETWITERQADGSTRVSYTGRIIAPDNQPEGALVATEHVIPVR